MSSPSPTSPFAPTRWTLVVRAQGQTPEARTALSELCEVYYQPVLRFLTCEGRDEDAARELTQEFFSRILASNGFDHAAPEHGRFRSYVLGALKHFLSDQRKREHRLKRGGGGAIESLDAGATDDDSGAMQVADDSLPAPDALFDREWALSLTARVLDLLEREFTVSGKKQQFDILKLWLMGEGPSTSQADAARQLGISEGALKVGIHRLRKRFRDALRSEISQTLRDPSTVDEELRHLIAAVS